MKNLVLIGGGHSHVIALRLFGLNPVAHIRLILISDVVDAPYSGMLPGHIAGFYNHAQCHINLAKLAKFAYAELVLDRAVGLDLRRQLVLCAQSAPVEFEWLSIDIGSTPSANLIDGAEHTIPVKPVPGFLLEWQDFLSSSANLNSSKIAIVGGGAGGVELALTMQARTNAKIHLFHRQSTLMPSFGFRIGNKFANLLQQRQVNLHLNQTVSKVALNLSETSKLPKKVIDCDSGLTLDFDQIFWVTNATAPAWIKNSGLQTDDQGFIEVDPTLRSVSHPQVFATGDIASIKNWERPKSGVFAVRQGKPLFQNLVRVIKQTTNQKPNQKTKPLVAYYPQKRHLALIGTGDGRAVAIYGKIWLGKSRLLWFWKDMIDQKFMRQFQDLIYKSQSRSNL